jgi:signal transduction histidine kinase
MSLADTFRRLRARIDVRAVFSTSGVMLVAIMLQCLGLSVYIAVESLEEGDRWVGHGLEMVAASQAHSGSEAAIEDLRESFMGLPPAVRLYDRDGNLRRTFGEWPAADRIVRSTQGEEPRSLRDFTLLWGGHQLVGEEALADGGRVEFALPLTEFASETTDVVEALMLIGVLSALVSLFVGIRMTSRALDPIRDATRILREVDARHLGSRIATRGSGDPVDRHAETLNSVLADIDASFARVRSFGSDVAHELRTPINRIRTLAEVALRSGDPDDQLHTLETVRQSSEDVSRIIESLLLLYEINDEAFVLQREEIDLDARILRSVDVYAPSFEERGIELKVDTRAGTVRADRTLTDRILVNLLSNGLRHVRRGDVVQIGAFRWDGGVVVCVDDSGPGIPPEERERIFDRFARLDPARSGGGSGLGLALARGIARLHGGDLQVGESPLGGARFVWNLPDASVERQRPERRSSPAPRSSRSPLGPQPAKTGGTRAP